MNPGRLCLATVTSDGFLPGTLVLVHSFLAHHPGWRGDIVVIHDEGLGPYSKKRLAQAFDRVRFVEPSDALNDRLDRLLAAKPALADRRTRFLSLEAFNLDYDRALIADSDLLIRAPLDDLFAHDAPLQAAGDGPYYWGGGRDRVTFDRLSAEQLTSDSYRPTFNAGFMLVDGSVLGPATYDALLDRLDPDGWAMATARLTDQRVLNIHFENAFRLLPASDNYPLVHRQFVHVHAGVSFTDARVLHYNEPWKPWQLDRLPDLAQRDPAVLATWKLWHEAYFDAVRGLFFRTALPSVLP